MKQRAFGLIVCFSLISLGHNSYVATFFTDEIKTLLQEKIYRLHDNSSPFYGNTQHIYCDHSTIEFNPSSDTLNKYKLHYDHIQYMKILAYAEDEHAQTVLIHTITDNDTLRSTNEYPHITISMSNRHPYTPVYSNDLWKRFVKNEIVRMEFDATHKPRSIVLNDGQHRQWNGRLTSDGKYASTTAYLNIFDDNDADTDLFGIVCVDNRWKNNHCEKN